MYICYKIFSILLISLLFTLEFNAQQMCRTESSGNPLISGPYVQDNQQPAPKTLRVYTHIVKCENCPDTYTDQEVMANIERLKNTFYQNNTQIYFYWDECVNVIEDDIFSTGIPDGQADVAYYNYITNYYSFPGGINIFYLPSDYSTFGSSEGFGYSLQIGGEAPYHNTSIMLAGSDPDENVPGRLIDLNVISHEMGHMLGLYHPFETVHGIENVPRTGMHSNCESNGDLLCGTPADPFIDHNVNSSCEWTESEVQVIDDITYDFAPDPTNIMTYSIDPCMINFSWDQIARMHDMIILDSDLVECLITDPVSSIGCHCVIDKDIIIENDIQWDESRSLNANIIVKDNASLTINADVNFSENNFIKVQKGGKLTINNATLSTCNPNDKWQGVVLVGNSQINQNGPSQILGHIEINDGTIENAITGIQAYDVNSQGEILSGGLVEINSGSILNCTTGVDFNRYGSNQGSFAWVDNSYINACDIYDCNYGIRIKNNRGVKVTNSDIRSNVEGIRSQNSYYILEDNFISGIRGVYAYNTWPTLEGSSVTSNTFSSSFADFILSGAGNLIGFNINNNVFNSSQIGFLNDGITAAIIGNNDFIDNQEGCYVSQTGLNSYSVDYNLFINSSYGTTARGYNTSLYNGNCFDNIHNFNIELYHNSSIGVEQGEFQGDEAGNCFDKSIPSMVTGTNTDHFSYHIKEGTSTTDCKRPSSANNYNWTLFTDAFDNLDGECGSSFLSGIPRNLLYCTIPRDSIERAHMKDSLMVEVQNIVQDTTISAGKKRWLLERLRKCYKRVTAVIVRDILNKVGGRSRAISLLLSTEEFDLNMVAYGLLIDAGLYNEGESLLYALNDRGVEGRADFIESQLIYLDHLKNKTIISAGNLSLIKSNGLKSNPYACFSRGIYQEVSGQNLPIEVVHIDDVNPRVTESIDDDPMFTIYPNPMLSNHITIQTEIMSEVFIYTSDGQEIYRGKVNNGVNDLTIPHTDHKVYFVKLIDAGGQVSIKKIMKL